MPTLPDSKHYVASALLVTQDIPQKALLLLHEKMRVWLPPGGHQHLNELPMETARREALEEVGIDIAPYFLPPKRLDDRAFLLPLPDYMFEEEIAPYKDEPHHFHIDLIYIVRVPTVLPINIQKRQDVGWYSLTEVEQLPLFENVKKLLELTLTPPIPI